MEDLPGITEGHSLNVLIYPLLGASPPASTVYLPYLYLQTLLISEEKNKTKNNQQSTHQHKAHKPKHTFSPCCVLTAPCIDKSGTTAFVYDLFRRANINTGNGSLSI